MNVRLFFLSVVSLFALVEGRGETLKLCVDVRDELGNPVSNATAHITALSKMHLNAGAFADDYSQYQALTDTNGLAMVNFEACSSLVYVWAEAEGYCGGQRKKVKYKAVAQGLFTLKFIEREKSVRIVLSRMRNPVPMHGLSRKENIRLPKNVCAVQLDLKKGALLPPFGKGEVPDVVITTWASNEVDRIRTGGTFQFLSGGAYKTRRSADNPYFVFYEADTNREYRTCWSYERTYVSNERQPVGGHLLEEDEVLVVRTRKVQCDSDGQRDRYNYAYIMGPLEIEDGIRWMDGQWRSGLRVPPCISHGPIVFNPTVNDPNLEIDWGRNLNVGRRAK